MADTERLHLSFTQILEEWDGWRRILPHNTWIQGLLYGKAQYHPDPLDMDFYYNVVFQRHPLDTVSLPIRILSSRKIEMGGQKKDDILLLKKHRRGGASSASCIPESAYAYECIPFKDEKPRDGGIFEIQSSGRAHLDGPRKERGLS